MHDNDGLPCPTTTYTCARSSSIGTPRSTTWGQLRRALTTHRRDRPDDKTHAPCWAPHVLDGTQRRKIAHVVSVSALVLDYDDGLDVSGAMGAFDGVERVAHSTYSATDDAPKCRLILPIPAPVAASVWTAVYRLILQDLGRGQQAADPKCIDPSRLFLLPVAGPVEEAAHERGRLIDLGPYLAEAEYRAELQARADAEREAERARRAAAARRWSDNADRSQGVDPDRRGKIELRTSPQARAQAAADLRAKIAERDGSRIAHGIPCPSCGRADVWFLLDPRAAWSARCNHAKSCGWHGQIADLLTSHGLSVARYGAL